MLRGVAIVLVLIEHLAIGFWANNIGTAQVAHTAPLDPPPPLLPHMEWLLPLYENHLVPGTAAVAVFFLISGFVIPMSLERYRPGRFIVARVFRLYPVWITSLAITAVVLGIYATVVGNAFPVADFGIWWRNSTLFFDWLSTPYINPVAWTLMVEVKFYLLLALLAWRFGLTRMLPIGISAGVLTVFTVVADGNYDHLALAHHDWWQAFYVLTLNSKFVVFTLIGLCFYNLFRGRWDLVRFLGMTTFLLGCFYVCLATGPDIDAWKKATAVSFATGFVVWCVAYVVRRWIPFSRPLNLLADISYPLYAVHYLLGMVLMTGFYALHQDPYLNMLEGGAVVVLISYALHRYVEAPGTRLGKTIGLTPGMQRRLRSLRPRRTVAEGGAQPPG
jgi:peptidoglycan/LPS O-acetylase OafA/YrhL